MTATEYLTLLGYLALVLGTGAYFSKHAPQSSAADYFLGGRRLGWGIVGLSYIITLLSTVSLVAIPGEAFNHGVGLSLRYLLSPVAAIIFFYVFTRFYFALQSFTPFEYLERRFDTRVRALASIAFFSIRLIYVALVLFSSARVFEGAAGWPPALTIIIVGAVGMAYVYLGGMRAVVWTDVLQFVVLFIGMCTIGWLAVRGVEGGVVELLQRGTEGERGFVAYGDPEFYSVNPFVRMTLWFILWVVFADRMFYASGDQICIQRLLSVSSYGNAQKTMWLSQILTVPTMALLWFVGLAVYVFYLDAGKAADMDGDGAVFDFVSSEAPPLVAGLFLGGMVAAIMSTLDSGIHSLTTVLMRDFYRPFVRKKRDAAFEMRLAKGVLLGLGVLSVCVALMLAFIAEGLAETFMETSIFWMSFQGLIAIVFLFGVASRRVTSGDILRAFCIGAAVTTLVCVAYWIQMARGNPISPMFVNIPGQLIMLLMLLGCALLRKQRLSGIDGLTLADWFGGGRPEREEEND